MAKYENLPIFKVATQFVLIMEREVLKMKKNNRYGLGEDLRKRASLLLSLVIRASFQAEKATLLLGLRVHIEEEKQFIQIAKDLGALSSFGAYQELMLKLEEIAKQNEGWLKSQKKKSSKPEFTQDANV
jgi:hypothetical protein